MAKSFKNNNPNDNILDDVPKTIDTAPQDKIPKAAVIDDTEKNHIPPIQKQEKKKPEYLRLDVTDYKDYISLMAEHLTNTSGKYVSMTQYILRLIEADKQRNIGLYEKLEQIENMKRELI